MILLDTQALVWAAYKPARLSRAAAGAIERARARAGITIASVTLYEAAQLAAAGDLRVVTTPSAWIQKLVSHLAVTIEELTPEIAIVAAHLPPDFPGDPFDRIIAATARVRGLPLVTSDGRIQDSGLVETIW